MMIRTSEIRIQGNQHSPQTSSREHMAELARRRTSVDWRQLGPRLPSLSGRHFVIDPLGLAPVTTVLRKYSELPALVSSIA